MSRVTAHVSARVMASLGRRALPTHKIRHIKNRDIAGLFVSNIPPQSPPMRGHDQYQYIETLIVDGKVYYLYAKDEPEEDAVRVTPQAA